MQSPEMAAKQSAVQPNKKEDGPFKPLSAIMAEMYGTPATGSPSPFGKVVRATTSPLVAEATPDEKAVVEERPQQKIAVIIDANALIKRIPMR